MSLLVLTSVCAMVAAAGGSPAPVPLLALAVEGALACGGASALHHPDVVGQALGRELIGGEAHSLDTPLVDQQDEGGVIDLGRYRLDRVLVPDAPHGRQGAVEELQAPGDVVLGQKRLAVRGGVL